MKNFKKYFIQRIIPGLVLIISSYVGYAQTNVQKTPPPPPTQYFIDSDLDGIYEEIQIVNEPVFPQGKEDFLRSFYRLVKYPALAREYGISGLVILEALVDEGGKVLNVEVIKSLSKECDEAARKAFIQATSSGYAPLILGEKSVKYKVTIPVRFSLG